MGLFKKLSSLFSSSPARTDQDVMWVTVRCNRCGEEIRARVNLNNDLSAEYGEGGTSFICRKQLMGEASGERLCFQRIEVELIFDERKKLVGREISGGQFVEAVE